MARVCSSCFDDPDIRGWIRGIGGPRGCDFCGGYDSPTAELQEVCDRIEECLHKFWGLAVEQLPYESSEGGYQGRTWDTADVVFDEEGLSLPRDDGKLFDAMLRELSNEVWCDWDWLSLDEDVAFRVSWETFCETVKHCRRFFFHSIGGSPEERAHYSAENILRIVANLCQQLGLVTNLPADTRIWRARADIPFGKRVSASDFGPPPKHHALQSNRMNPPGIPMMYAASTARTALHEINAVTSRIGQWKTLRPLTILDLRYIPKVPGTFSDATREQTLGINFIHHFSNDIMIPVERDERVHIDYLPSQVITEYLRDFEFDSGRINGIAYNSTVVSKGWNLALFAEPHNLCLDPFEPSHDEGQWLKFQKSIRFKL